MIYIKSLTILVDMDDTIESLLPSWVGWLNMMFGTDVDYDAIREWDMAQSFPSLTKEQVYAPLLCEEFWYTVMPKQDAVDVLQQIINDGHRVYIVTTSAYQTLRVKMDAVLFGYFPYFTWDDVIITSNKQLINGDVLVDDGVHNLEGGAYYKILMDAPHNRNYEIKESDMQRTTSWNEVYEIICNLSAE